MEVMTTLVVVQLQTRVDQLTKLNNDHRRRASLSRRQAQQLIEDKAELQALLHDRDHELSQARDRLKRYSRDAAVDRLTSTVRHGTAVMFVMKYTLLSAVLPSKTTHLGVFYYRHDHPWGIVINSASLVI